MVILPGEWRFRMECALYVRRNVASKDGAPGTVAAGRSPVGGRAVRGLALCPPPRADALGDGVAAHHRNVGASTPNVTPCKEAAGGAYRTARNMYGMAGYTPDGGMMTLRAKFDPPPTISPPRSAVRPPALGTRFRRPPSAARAPRARPPFQRAAHLLQGARSSAPRAACAQGGATLPRRPAGISVRRVLYGLFDLCDGHGQQNRHDRARSQRGIR